MELLNSLIQYFIEAYKINPLWQIAWIIAFIVSVYNFTYCKNTKFIIVTAIASFIWSIHFFSIWLITAAAINIFDVFKNLLAIKYTRNNKWVIFFIISYFIIGVFTYSGILSIIPTITALIWTYLVFYVRWIWLNIWFLWVISLWMVYNYAGSSIWWLSTDIFLLLSGIIWVSKELIQVYIKNKKIWEPIPIEIDNNTNK